MVVTERSAHAFLGSAKFIVSVDDGDYSIKVAIFKLNKFLKNVSFENIILLEQKHHNNFQH